MSEILCALCSVKFTDQSYRSGRRFCSHRCRALFHAVARTAPETDPPTGTAWVPIGKKRAAIVDQEAVDLAAGILWYDNRQRRQIRGWSPTDECWFTLHRLIVRAADEDVVDHHNGDYLDNRRSNLRVTTTFGNTRNSIKRRKPSTSRFKGVCFVRRTGRWQAFIRRDGANVYLGSYASEKEAAESYDRAARVAFGSFACLNFPLPGERSALHGSITFASQADV